MMKVSEHIHALKIPFQIKNPQGEVIDRFVYMYLIFGKKVYLIDSGISSARDIIFNYLEKEGRSKNDIVWLFLTHSHPDHIGAAAEIKEKTGCRVAAHKGEKSWIEDVGLQAKERPVPGFRDLVKGPVIIDKILKDGEIVELEEYIELEVIYTPGHSQGSVSFFLPCDKALFSADAVPLPGSIPIYDDPFIYAHSITKLKAVANVELLLSAWDEPRRGEQVYNVMDRGIDYLQSIHDKVIEMADKSIIPEPMQLCKAFVRELKLPQIMINPLVAKSLWSNYNLRGKKKLVS